MHRYALAVVAVALLSPACDRPVPRTQPERVTGREIVHGPQTYRRPDVTPATPVNPDEYDVDGLVLLRKTVRANRDVVGYTITGTVVNRRPETVRYVEITYYLVDASGARVDTAVANITDLAPGERWNFKAVGLDNRATRYRLAELKGQ